MHLLFLVVVALLVAWGVEAVAAVALLAVVVRKARCDDANDEGDAAPVGQGPADGGPASEGGAAP
ncbi:MAG TPA: hypothetical protein VMU14_03495 [Acidimicrobiales bacterium]|nr:hypothetical protein [Acidimicrobiales bacterium]